MMKLYYFDLYVRAEPIRMLLKHAKLPFEDIRLSHDDFRKIRAEGKLEFKSVPMLEMEGKSFVQSQAILKLLGRKYGYYPRNDDIYL